jgi:ABC-type dipeptide/oligopeptide/nickel transport system ATPase component
LFSSAAGNAEASHADNEKEREKSAIASDAYCSFAPRCSMASERCFREHPELTQVSAGHSIRCFNYKQS